MSKAEIEIPDDGWFHRECKIRPQDKQLCVIIPKDDMIPRIYHYRDGCFYEVLDVLILKNIGIDTKCIEAEYGMQDIELWKPLGLLPDVNKRIMSEIEKCFVEEDE